jgi:hypothetical protein
MDSWCSKEVVVHSLPQEQRHRDNSRNSRNSSSRRGQVREEDSSPDKVTPNSIIELPVGLGIDGRFVDTVTSKPTVLIPILYTLLNIAVVSLLSSLRSITFLSLHLRMFPVDQDIADILRSHVFHQFLSGVV